MHDMQLGLAEFVVRPPASALAPEVLEPATAAVIDALAAILAGTTSDLADAVFDYADSFADGGRHPVLGTSRLLSSDRAALVNATFGHSMDFDDTVSLMPGHPGTVIVSALLATMPPEGSTGKDFLRAFVVGYEVATKLGASIGMGHYDRGWHSTGTIGVFGAFAAAAHLMRLDVPAVERGFGIVASMASGLRINFGTMTKPLHSGWAASSGVTAAQLAATGFTGHTNALFAKDGFFSAYGTEASTPDALLSTLGAPFTLVSPGIALKKYPCCYALHRPIDALEMMRTEVAMSPETVSSVEVRVAPGSLKPVPYERPVTGFEGRFSMNYVLAVGVLDGDFGMDAFTDEAVSRPAIRELLERVTAVEHPDCSPGDLQGLKGSAGTRGHVEVIVRMTDGREFRRSVEKPPGSPFRPLSREQVTSKFRACAARTSLSEEQIAATLSILARIEECPDVRVLLDLLTVDESPVDTPLSTRGR